MRYFSDHTLPYDCKIGITNLLSNITTREGSHKGGWARLLKCQLVNLKFSNVKILDNKDRFTDFDVIIFDLGAEYSGALNMFGGLDEKVYKRLKDLEQFKGPLFSWKNELPKVDEALKSRSQNASTCEQFKNEPGTFLRNVQINLERTIVFDHVVHTGKLLIGDSHTPSVWTPEFMIERRDGRTLKGMLEHNTLQKYVETIGNINTVQVHCGSIDIRHHICREEDPIQTIAEMVQHLVLKLHKLNVPNIVLTETMGIEDESRELPKTGYFRGTPFYGEWGSRKHVKCVFDELCEAYTTDQKGWSLIKFPPYFSNGSGQLRFEVMEKPGSVHLSPEHYFWDLERNCLRWGFNQLVSNIEKDMYGA